MVAAKHDAQLGRGVRARLCRGRVKDIRPSRQYTESARYQFLKRSFRIADARTNTRQQDDGERTTPLIRKKDVNSGEISGEGVEKSRGSGIQLTWSVHKVSGVSSPETRA